MASFTMIAFRQVPLIGWRVMERRASSRRAPRRAQRHAPSHAGRLKEIAADLGISAKTVESHYERIRKLGIQTLPDLRRHAIASALAAQSASAE